jgi:hypothetical protein
MRQEFADLEKRWAEAVRDRDIRFLERLLAPEFTLTTGRRPNPLRVATSTWRSPRAGTR